MKKLATAGLLGFGLCLVGACSSGSGGEPDQAPAAETSADANADGKFQGQAVALVPLGADDACLAVPTTMSHDVLAGCIGMDATKLPADYRVVTNVADFEPEKKAASILMIPAIDGYPAPWYVFIGMGPMSNISDGTLTHPQTAALLAGAASLTGAEAAEGLGLILAPEVVVPALVIGGAIYLITQTDTGKALINTAVSLLTTKKDPPCSGGYYCSDSRSSSQGGCDGAISGSPCTYKDSGGTTYGSQSGFCGGTRSFSSMSDGSNRCIAPCTCRSNAPGR